VPAAPAGPPGPAYFAVDRKGVVRLDHGKLTLLANSPDTLIKDLQLGGDGAVWVVGYEDVLRLEGDKFRRVTRGGFSDLGASIDHFAVTAEGHVWAATFKGVSHFDGKAWTTEHKAKIGAGEGVLDGIAVDRAGKVFVASTHGVHVRDGGVWKDIDLTRAGARDQLFLEDVALAPDGAVYVLASALLMRVAPGSDTPVKVPLGAGSFVSYNGLDVASNGSLAVRDGDNVVAYPAGGDPRGYDGRKGADFRADNIRAVAADDTGRVWVASALGVAILGPGDAKTEWPAGSMPELIGEVEDILVVGSGPATLPAAGPVQKGGLTGKVLRDGSPLAGVSVELCPSPSMMFIESPCDSAGIKFAATADENGVWTFQDVPLGTYGLAVEVDGKWQITLGERVGIGMKAGKVHDTGSMRLDRK
ncbi:MAG TPA: hypothetical protein VGB85_02175, partial [Nannocystis sp.]